MAIPIASDMLSMRLLTLLLLPGLLLALGACGGSNSEAEKIKRLIERSGTSKDPSVCSPTSDSFVAQTSFGSRAAAKDNERFCRENIARLLPHSIHVSRVDVDGDRAEAEFAPEGGLLVFDEATLELRKSGGRWRVQRLKAITLDRMSFEDGTAKQLTSGADAYSAGSARCFVRRMRRVPDAEIERGIVGADPGFLLDATVRCGLAPELRKQGFSSAQARCFTRGLLRREPTRVMEILLGEGRAADARTGRLFDNILRFCPS